MTEREQGSRCLAQPQLGTLELGPSIITTSLLLRHDHKNTRGGALVSELSQ